MLGTRIDVPILNGKVKITIPYCAHTDEVLRLWGKGLSHYNETGHGHLNLPIMVDIPRDPNREHRKLFK